MQIAPHADKFVQLLTEHLQDTKIQGIAVGLSGGGDSWALALLAHDYCREHSIPFIALTVDHQLRPESADEAASVTAECARRHIQHQILSWQHEGISSRKQEQARIARYDLMGDYCAAHNFSHLLTAHHANDQAETVLLRFAKGSGSAGLSGMAPSRPLNNTVTLLRPLLSVRKQELLDYAAAAGVPVITDPSNSNPAYARARLRATADALASEGLTTEILLKIAATARAEREALDYATQNLILTHMNEAFELPAAIWQTAPPALQQIAFLTIWRQLKGSAHYPPDRDSILALCAALTTSPCRRTLGGLIAERKREIVSFGLEKLS